MLATPAPQRTMVPELIRICRVTREMGDIFTWTFDASLLPGGFSFEPGQFNMLYLFGTGEVPISISGDPGNTKEIVHTIRAVGTVTNAMAELRKGDTIGLRGPYGSSWPLASAKEKDLLIVAGGLGLAPLRPAILHALNHRDDYRRVSILYGARSPADLLYRKEIEQWRGRLDTKVEVTVDRAGADWFGNVGVVPALLSDIEIEPAQTVAFVCGPEIMMRFTVRELRRLGVPGSQVYVSMERNMKCGAGLCGHCQYGPTFVCKDGPVYAFDQIERIFWTREI